MEFKVLSVRDIMSRDIVFVRPTAAVSVLVEKMAGSHISSVIVGTNGEGVVTERDLITRVLKAGLNPKKTKVKEIMSDATVSVQEDANLQEASDIMRSNKIRHLLVRNSEGKVTGIISETDLVRASKGIHQMNLVYDRYFQVQLFVILALFVFLLGAVVFLFR